jgi:hypothetical protein
MGVRKSPARVTASARRSPPWQPRFWRGVIAVCNRVELAARPAIAGDVPALNSPASAPHVGAGQPHLLAELVYRPQVPSPWPYFDPAISV